MARLEDLSRGSAVKGILPDSLVTVVDVKWYGSAVVELIYKDAFGHLGNELLYRDREPTLEIALVGHPWSFDADGSLFRLVSEAYRIRLAHLFDPLLAVHTSLVDPLPHQITAVYGEMLARQPLRFLLADDPGAGKTIMTGLLLKELLIRGDLHRCLICCHLWNLVATETREGDVFDRLLKKLEQQRESLGGSVFDVLGKCFSETPLRDLLIEAIRYGDRPEVRARLTQVIDHALDSNHLQQLIEERALTHETLSAARVQQIREDMERAEARRLQPHFIASFFREAFALLGGTLREREPHRYEITHVPAVIRNRDRIIGTGEPVLTRYERITCEKNLASITGKPLASFVCPGHPLLDATIDLILKRYRDLLKRGAILVDPHDRSNEVRALFYLEHALQDARTDRSGNRRVVSRQLQFVEIDSNGQIHTPGYAPYLDYRPLTNDERAVVASTLEAAWLRGDLKSQIIAYAAAHLVPQHLGEVKARKEELVRKTLAAVKDRLTKEIAYWDHRAEQLKAQESAGKPLAKMNSALARQRADKLEGRLRQRMEELEQERHLSPLPPVVIGGALVVPQYLLQCSQTPASEEVAQAERERIDRLAVAAVMEAEHRLGHEPHEMPHEHPGYDIESKDSASSHLRFIEVKGKAVGATTVTISKTQIFTALNKPDDFILAIVEVDGDTAREPRYIRRPFQREPDFGVTSVNYDLDELLARGEKPA